MAATSRNSFGTRTTLHVGDRTVTIYDLTELERSGVANAAKRLFQGGEQGVGTVGGFADPDRPIAEILAEFEPRHRETMRLFLRERIHVAESRDPARMASLDAELEALGPSAVVATPDRTGSATPHALGTGAATGESPPTDDLE